MKSLGMGRGLGAMLLLATVAGHAAPLPVADAPPLKAVTRAQFEAWFKEISNWGRWGKDDELGTLNLITAEKRRTAAALVSEGVSVSLSLDVNKTADALNVYPFEQALTVGEFGGHAVAEDRYSVRYHGFAHSHMDGLTHFAHAGTLYNGVPVSVLEKGGESPVRTSRRGRRTLSPAKRGSGDAGRSCSSAHRCEFRAAPALH